MLEVFYPLFLYLFVGFVIIYLCGFVPNWNLLAQGGLAYGIGIGCITLQMMFYSFFHIPWYIAFIVIPWVLLILVKISLAKPQLQFKNILPNSFNVIEGIILFFIVSTIFFVFIEAMIHPLLAFDGWANWFLGGKAFYISHSLNPRYILYANNSTPPVISLMIAFVYLAIGQSNDQVAMLFFTGFYLSLLMIFYQCSKQYMPRTFALLFVFLLATIENVIRHAGRYDVGYADLPLGYFFFCSTMFLLQFLKDKSIHSFVLFQFFITTGSLVKSEGIPFYVISQILLLGILLFKRNRTIRLKHILFLLTSVVIIFSWYVYKHIYHLPENPFIRPSISFERIPVVLSTMSKEFLNFSRWNLLWIGYIVALLLSFRYKITRIIGMVTLLQLFVYFCVYLTTPLDPVMHIHNSFDRLLLHITPLAVLLISITFTYQKFGNARNNKIR